MTFEDVQRLAIERCKQRGEAPIVVRGQAIPSRDLDRVAVEIMLEYMTGLEYRIAALEEVLGVERAAVARDDERELRELSP